MGLDLFKLEKLTISAFNDVQRGGMPATTFETMFNPASYSQTYAVVWGKQQALNSSGAELSYTRNAPSRLSLDLVIDGTGVDEMGILALGQKSVSERIKDFLDVTYTYNGAIHEANYLLVEWGKLSFPCRLASATINYTKFDRDGTPLRAEIKVELAADASAKKLSREENKTSPDLTHSRLVKEGDTLPLLTKQIYGTPDRYLDIARFNHLDNFRRLTPGRTLVFPSLARLANKGG